MTHTDNAASPLETLSDWLITAGIDEPHSPAGREQIVARVLCADDIARQYAERDDNPGWPADQSPPTQRDLFVAIVKREYRTLLDHALAWAAYQVELHQAAPGDQWQVLSVSAGDVWQANAVGPREAALGGYQIEVALRGIVIHLERESFDLATLDMQAVFQAIDRHAAQTSDRTVSLAPALARVGLRGVGLDSYIY